MQQSKSSTGQKIPAIFGVILLVAFTISASIVIPTIVFFNLSNNQTNCSRSLIKATLALDASTSILQLVAILVLSISLLIVNCKECSLNCHNCCYYLLVSGIMIVIAGLAVTATHLKNIELCYLQPRAQYLNTAYESISFFSGIIVLLIAVHYFFKSRKKWTQGLEKNYNEKTDEKTDEKKDEKTDEKKDEKKDDKKKDDEMKRLIKEKYAYLYSQYLQIGNSTKNEKDILQPWFVIQYTVYLTSALVWIVRVANHFNEEKKHDIEPKDKFSTYFVYYALTSIAFDSLAFLIPYGLGLWINHLHTIYYDRMIEEYLEWKGKSYKVYYNEENCDVEYFEYYSLAMSKRISKMPDFDFNPSLLGMKIPLNSSGYIFAIYVSIAASIFTAIKI